MTHDNTTLHAARARVSAARKNATACIWAFAETGFASLELAENLSAATLELATATGLLNEAEALRGGVVQVHEVILESAATVDEIAAALLRTTRAWHPCTQPALVTALMLATRAEIDRSGLARDYACFMFAELLKLARHEVTPDASKPKGVQ